MAVTNYTSLLGLALPTTGDLAGTWGDTVNNSITSLLDSAVAGTTSISSDSDVTLTTTQGAANQARSAILNCTGARTALRTIIAPAASKAYVVINATTGGFGVKVVGAGPTTGVTINNGEKALIAWNGSDFVIVSTSIIDLGSEVSGVLPIANGGTNSTATPTNGGVGYGTGTAHAYSAAGTSGQVLTSAGAASPTWTNQGSLTAGAVTNAVTFNNGGTGAASGTTYNGSAAQTISYNTIGAPSTTGTNASGTWAISVTGSAGSVTNAVTFNNGGAGAASGTTYNGSAAQTISYNSVGASPLAGSTSLTTLGTVTTGTWNATAIGIGYGGTNASTAAQALINLGERTGATGSAILPAGTTDQRDASPAAGYFRYNTTNSAFEGYNGTAWEGVGVVGLASTYYDQSALFSGSQTSLVLPNINVIVNGTLVRIAGATLALGTVANWDNSSYATAGNRAGKDFYVYALQAGGVILSANSTYPTGYTASNSRKIGGFHCLAVAVGTISGHTLSGYVAGDILPRSVWDRFNRSSARQEGTILSRSGVWVDIYLPSVSGSNLVSVNGGTIADGASSPAFHCYKFEQWLARQGMKSISQLEFFAASDGANQGTNITGSADPGTTTGHTDTGGRRMISNEGVEDTCGVVWQWTRDQGGVMTAAAWANAFDANDAGVGGQHYLAPYRGLLGSAWNDGAICGSRASNWSNSPLVLYSGRSVRGVAEPAVNRF